MKFKVCYTIFVDSISQSTSSSSKTSYFISSINKIIDINLRMTYLENLL